MPIHTYQQAPAKTTTPTATSIFQPRPWSLPAPAWQTQPRRDPETPRPHSTSAGFNFGQVSVFRPGSARPDNAPGLRLSGHKIPVASWPTPKPTLNRTGLPDRLKAGVEALSGMSLDDVRVHYNSSKPAQLQALAYTQGAAIYVGPGQERHLPHEVWHVVQQLQSRVHATIQTKGAGINDAPRFEREADMMGEKAVKIALREGLQEKRSLNFLAPTKALLNPHHNTGSGMVIQKKNRIDRHIATNEKHPLSILDENFKKQNTTGEYSVKAGGGGISLSKFYNGKTHLQRPTQVIAKLDGPCRPLGARNSDQLLQSAMGNIGDHERAVMGRSTIKTYEGGHLISDKLLGIDSYVEYNFAPQHTDVNAPVYRHVEELAEKGIIDKTTLTPTPGAEITMQVELTYENDPYHISVADLINNKVIPSTFTQTDTGATTITFPRRVPNKWEVSLSFDLTKFPNSVFPNRGVGQTSLNSLVGKSSVVNPTLRRMESQEYLWGMESVQQHRTTGKYSVGGQSMEHFIVYQPTPLPLTQQPAYSGTVTPPTRSVPTAIQPSLFSGVIKVNELDDTNSDSYKLMMVDLKQSDLETLAKEINRVVKKQKTYTLKLDKKGWKNSLRKLKTKKNKKFAERLENDTNIDLS